MSSPSPTAALLPSSLLSHLLSSPPSSNPNPNPNPSQKRKRPTSMAGLFGDTTYTKVFVGGLAWETKKESMSKYFEEFGEILEAVVITDKNSGRSKGYGFVTFREPEAATRACVDPSPVIDGRRANCNLASLGVQKSAPTTPPPAQGGAKKSFRPGVKAFHNTSGLLGGMGAAFASVAFAHNNAVQQGISYNVYGYTPYSPEYTYPAGYYNLYGGTAAQYPIYGGSPGLVSGAPAFYPYYQFGQGAGAYGRGNGYAMQQPHMFQYPTMTGFTPHYAGMNLAVTAPALSAPTAI